MSMGGLRDHLLALIRSEVSVFQLRPLCPLWFNPYQDVGVTVGVTND